MQINEITKCCKPKAMSSFQRGNVSPNEGRVRYKHLETAPDEVLISKSIMKAHNEVKHSNKMRLYKSLPAITTGIIATSLAITQPGKLSVKAAQGLGFLALSECVNIASNLISKKSDSNNSSVNFFAGLGAVFAATVGATAALKGLSNVKALEGIKNFAQSEITKLAGEINSTKLAEFSNKTIQPVLQKYPKASVAAMYGTVIGACAANSALQSKLAKSLSNDVKVKSEENFENAKKIQQIAREHFNSIQAQEV